MKERYSRECKICARPFTTFRWCPGTKMRYKRTEICQTCSQMKNVCQTCLLDLEYGLPTQVRDAALRVLEKIPQSDVNKEYYVQNMENQMKLMEEGGQSAVVNEIGGCASTTAGGKSSAASDMLAKLARTVPYYKRNLPHICSFWVKGECKRGEECPYRHEKPNEPDDPLSEQNIRDRYYGVNDPVADKLLKRAATMPKLESPEDKTITTLYIGNINEHITEVDIRDNFYHYGEIRSVSLVPRQQCAFVQFTKRSAAELAADKTFNKLVLGGKRLSIKWARSQAKQSTSTATKINRSFDPVPGLPGTLPMPPVPNDYFNLQASEMAVLPPGMKLNQLPRGLLPGAPATNLRDHDAFYSLYSNAATGIPLPNAPVTARGGKSTGNTVSFSLYDNKITYSRPTSWQQLHYPSQDPARLGTVKK